MPRRNAAVDRVHEVYDASYRRLVGQLTGVTGDPVEAEDAVMEAFARAVNHSRAFLDADNPEAWLRTVAVNVTRTRPTAGRARAGAQERAPDRDHVTPSGRLVAATSDLDGWGVQATEDGRTWESVRVAPPGTSATPLVAGAGDHVAVVFSEAAPDRSLPVLEVLVSSDAGRTWAPVDGLDTRGPDRVRDAHSLVVDPGGTTYLMTATDGLLPIGADGHAEPAALAPTGMSAFATDDGVCVEVGAGVAGALRCSSDDGATWSDPQPLPGLR